MGFLDILCDVFGIETKAEQEAKVQAEQKAFGTSQKVEQPTSEKEKEDKERVWKNPNDPFKYVCHGGTVECPFCSPTSAPIIVTSNTLKLQDKPWTTVQDKDGKVNFNFAGVCKHPSQQKPGSPPPPCKTVISLGSWKGYSETHINNDKALLMKSTIPCNISGQELKITDCGQKAALTDVSIELPKIQVKILSIDTEYFTPLGIQNPVNKDIKTSGLFSIKYEISGQKASSIRFSVYSKDDDLIGFESLASLEEVIITGKKAGSKPNKKPTHSIKLENNILEEEHLNIGTHAIRWDGFNDDGILDTSKLTGKLRFQVSVVSSDGLTKVGSALVVKTERVEPAAKWVEAVVTNTETVKKIDVSINVNLVDGGEKGLSCSTYHYTTGGSPTVGAPGEYHSGTVCDWDKIPASEIKPNNLIIKSRTRSFEDLVSMVLDGMQTYWSRNGNRGNGITVNSVNFTVNTSAENTTKKPPYSLDDIPLIFNTNNDWGRSGNPGGNYGGIISGATKGLDYIIGGKIQQITYNVGYIYEIKYLETWGYEETIDADLDFSETAAHEIGHEILQAFGGDVYSYQHKGSSYLTQKIKPTTPPDKKWYDHLPGMREYEKYKDLMKDVNGEYAPTSGEQDLMKYYHDQGSKDYNRIVAAEDDMKGLIWLTSIKIENK